MANAGNFQYTRKRALTKDKKTVAAAYTVRTGTVSNRLKFDNPVVFTNPAADMTVTVPSGTFIGQRILLVMSSNTSSKTVSVSVTNHATSDPEVFTFDAADEMLELLWTGTEWVTALAVGVTT